MNRDEISKVVSSPFEAEFSAVLPCLFQSTRVEELADDRFHFRSPNIVPSLPAGNKSYLRKEGNMQHRRAFLKSSAATAALYQSVLGANDRIRIGLIGVGRRGQWLQGSFLRQPDCAVTAVCDVFKPHLEEAVARVDGKVDSYRDYRRLLERKDIDAVSIATPDHWHGPITVDACQAGKDVYVEKPLSNSIEAGWKMVEAAKKYNRVVQVSLQQRSTPHFQEAAKLVQEGFLGQITHAVVMFDAAYTSPAEPTQPPPPGLDWEMFQGPAPRHPYSPTRHRQWRTFYDYGGGVISDWGVHWVDIIHWYLNAPPPQTVSAAAQYVRVAISERDQVPDAFSLSWQYDTFVMSFTNCKIPNAEHDPNGGYFFGTKGMMLVNRSGYLAKPLDRVIPYRRGRRPEPAFKPLHVRPLSQADALADGMDLGTDNHVRDFLDCVKSRRATVCSMETGFYSTLPTLMALLAIRQGKTIAWDGGGQVRAL